MNNPTSTPLRGFLAQTWSLLRPYPGRGNLMLRCLIASTLVMLVSLTLQVPFMALSLISVFYVAQKNIVLSRLTGMLFITGTTLAVAVSILLLKLTWSWPLLRLTLAGGLFFTCAWLMRLPKIGVIFFLSGIVIIYTQTFADLTDNADSVIRLILWLWVAINYAIILTLAINLLFLPLEPVNQLRTELRAQLAEIMTRLNAYQTGNGQLAARHSAEVQEKMLALQQLLAFSIMRDSRYRQNENWHLARITTVSGLYMMAQKLPVMANRQSDQQLAEQLIHGCQRFILSIDSDTPPRLEDIALPMSEMQNILTSMGEALAAFSHQQPGAIQGATTSVKAKQNPTLTMHPAWNTFAFKTLLSTMVCYLLYIAADWQGIHTIMLSCIIVAQSSLGATAQRGLLRIIGAAMGSLAALLMVILVMPHIDGIVGLLAMSLPIIALGAWLYAGSEKVSYAGIQMMFTFSLALLETFGPTFELVEIRDRIIGIVLGVLIATLVHAFLWPERENKLFWERTQQLLLALAERATVITQTPGSEIALRKALSGCQGIAARVAMEPSWTTDRSQSESDIFAAQNVLGHLSEIIYQLEHLNTGLRDQATPALRQEACQQLRFCAELTMHPVSGNLPAMLVRRFPPALQPLFFELRQLMSCLHTRHGIQ